MRRMLIVLVALCAMTGAACSGDGGGSTGGDSTGGESTGVTGSTGASGSTDTGCTVDNAVDLTLFDPFIVTIQDLAFQPDCFDAKSASSIRVENRDTVTHTFTIDGTQVDVSIEGGQTFNGESAGLEPGSYDFRCTIHSSMTGTVIVS